MQRIENRLDKLEDDHPGSRLETIGGVNPTATLGFAGVFTAALPPLLLAPPPSSS